MHQGELSSRFLFSASLMEAALPTSSSAVGWTLRSPAGDAGLEASLHQPELITHP